MTGQDDSLENSERRDRTTVWRIVNDGTGRVWRIVNDGTGRQSGEF